MSVDVRRRSVRVSVDSEGLSEDSYEDSDAIKGSEGETDLNISSECQQESEYETLDEGGEDESVSGEDLTAVDDDRDDEDLSDSVIIELEREEGDGQESVPPKEKKLDDDEDRRNPQYIPKRGTFYEHDDRTAAEDTNEDAADKDGERGKDSQNEKKKVWKEHENRWSHDRYNEDEQLPKSKEELVAIYGYDIRNEDAPPRARRRRKYGRGPNKYTRNWEDVDAYGKSSAVILRGTGSRRRGRGGRHGGSFTGNPRDTEKEFPPLGGVSSITTEESEDINNSIYASRAAERRQERGSKPQQRDAFPPLSSFDQTKTDLLRHDHFSRDDRVSNSPNAWRKDRNSSIEVQKLDQENWKTTFSSNTSSSGSNNTINNTANVNNRTLIQVDDRRERVSGRGSRTYEQSHENEGEDEDNDDDGWNLKNRPVPSKGSGIVLESQTINSSGILRGRGRGRGVRKSTSRQSTEFKSNLPRGQVNKRGGSYRSHSETRLSSHDEGSGSEGGNYIVQVNSHVVSRTENVTRDMGRMSLNDLQLSNGNKDYSRRPNKTPPNYQNSERRQPVVPPRMQENAANKPKRYSSQRQKTLPETGGPAYAQPQGYYASGYVPQPEELEGVGYVQQPVYAEAPQQPSVVQPPTTPPLALIPPHAHAQAQAFAAPFPSPPTFMPPPVAGPPPRILPPGAAPYLAATPTAPPLINYVPTPTQGQFPPQAYPAFQGYTTVPAAQPPELYQPQGGITYYSPEEQMMARTTIAQKRPSTAIPIVPPPDRGPRGRGRAREASPNDATPGANSSTEDAVVTEDSKPSVTEPIQEEMKIETKVNDSTTQDVGSSEFSEKIEENTSTQGTEIVTTVPEQEIPA